MQHTRVAHASAYIYSPGRKTKLRKRPRDNIIQRFIFLRPCSFAWHEFMSFHELVLEVQIEGVVDGSKNLPVTLQDFSRIVLCLICINFENC